MKPIISILIIAVVIIAGFVAYSFYSSPIEHSITFYFHDGTTSTIPILDITHSQKRVDTIEYNIEFEGYDISQYTPYFDTPMGIYQLEPSITGIWSIPIYEIVNYNVDDGEYEIKLVPFGTITQNDKSIILPGKLTFKLAVDDNRNINLVFV